MKPSELRSSWVPFCGLHWAHRSGHYASEGNGPISKNENFKEVTWAPFRGVAQTPEGVGYGQGLSTGRSRSFVGRESPWG